MAYNGSGTFSLVAGNPVVTGTTISSTWANDTLNDIATGLSTAITKDGQTTPTANIPLGGFKLTGLGAATANGDAVRYEQVQSLAQAQTGVFFTTGGTTTAYTLTPTPALGSLIAGQRFNVVFNAANTTASTTLAISGLTAKTLKVYDYDGVKTDPAIGALAANMIADVVYDGTDYVVLDQLPSSPKQIQSITASVAANALTITVNPTTLDFRSATLGSGTVNTLTLATAASLVISSGSTLGTVNAVQSRIVVLLIDNAGTLEVAAVNISGGNDLSETGLISTTAEGGAGAADSATVIYSTTARSNVPYRVVGYVESTQATAGTWATAPSTIQGQGGQALAAMSSLGYGQTWQSVTGSRVIGTTYYNTTGKPIAIAVVGNPSTALVITLTIGGVVADTQSAASSVASNAGVHGIVPPESSYVVTVSTGVLTVNTWSELR